MVTLIFQSSIWLWIIYLIVSAQCGTRDNPDTESVFITAIVFVVLMYLIMLGGLCHLDQEDSAVMKKTSIEDFQEYLERVRNMAPRDMIEGSSYHYETVPNITDRDKSRSEKVKSFSGAETFHYD